MSTKIVVTWALVATAVAIGSLGYILGKQAGSVEAHSQWLPTADQTAATDATAGAREPQVVYTIPKRFAGQPQEWRSDDIQSLQGYAALFAPAQRELLVEHCKHKGYPQDDSGRFHMPNESFCESVLWVTLASLSEDRASGIDKSGQPVDVRLELDGTDDAPVLRLRFEGHDARMMPGSKNDLLQAMEKHPEIAAQKKRFMMAMASGNGERNAQAKAATPDRP